MKMHIKVSLNLKVIHFLLLGNDKKKAFDYVIEKIKKLIEKYKSDIKGFLS